jgi:hypothetical protein
MSDYRMSFELYYKTMANLLEYFAIIKKAAFIGQLKKRYD